MSCSHIQTQGPTPVFLELCDFCDGRFDLDLFASQGRLTVLAVTAPAPRTPVAGRDHTPRPLTSVALSTVESLEEGADALLRKLRAMSIEGAL